MAAARNFVTNPVAWTLAALVALYAMSAHLAPVRVLSEAWIIALIVASSSVMIAVGPVALRCFTSRGWPHPDDAVGLGMFLTAFGMFWLGLWSLFWRLSGQSAWVVNNDLYNAWRPFVIAGMLTKVTAIGVFGGHVPRGYKVRYGLILLLAAALILLLALTRPDLRPIADWLRPYLEEVRSLGSFRPANASVLLPP